MTVAAHPHGQVTKKIRGSLDCCRGISNFQHPVTVSKKGPIAPDVPDVGSQFQVTSKYPPLQNVHWGVCTPSKYTCLSLGNTFPGEFILYQMTVWVKGVVRLHSVPPCPAYCLYIVGAKPPMLIHFQGVPAGIPLGSAGVLNPALVLYTYCC